MVWRRCTIRDLARDARARRPGTRPPQAMLLEQTFGRPGRADGGIVYELQVQLGQRSVQPRTAWVSIHADHGRPVATGRARPGAQQPARGWHDGPNIDAGAYPISFESFGEAEPDGRGSLTIEGRAEHVETRPIAAPRPAAEPATAYHVPSPRAPVAKKAEPARRRSQPTSTPTPQVKASSVGDNDFDSALVDAMHNLRSQQAEAEAQPRKRKLDASIFDRLGQQMRYSNAFDGGTFDLSERFRQFEAELDAEAEGRGFTPVDELDDLDLAAELSALEIERQQQNAAADPSENPKSAEADPVPEEPPPPRQVLLAQDRIESAMAAAATLIAWQHGLPNDAEALLTGRGGWSVFGRPPPGALLQAIDHYGLETAAPGTADNAEKLRELIGDKGALVIGTPEGPGVLILAGISGEGESTRFKILDPVAESQDAARMELDHAAMLARLRLPDEPMPLLVAYV
jgi:hypothetical protein